MTDQQSTHHRQRQPSRFKEKHTAHFLGLLHYSSLRCYGDVLLHTHPFYAPDHHHHSLLQHTHVGQNPHISSSLAVSQPLSSSFSIIHHFTPHTSPDLIKPASRSNKLPIAKRHYYYYFD
jgi:hypothetical protein